MRRPSIATLCFATVVLGPSFAEEAVDPVARLIAELDCDEWEVREAATRRLASLMPEALPRLLDALRTGSAEVRTRIRSILGPLRVSEDGTLRQWAVGAAASSEYSSDGWCARQATGEPDTLEAGDRQTAWASRDADGGIETLELEFQYAVVPERLSIHETYNPGAVVRVEVMDKAGASSILWEGKDPTAGAIGVFEVPLDAGGRALARVRIVLDSAAAPGWNEIDAVELAGRVAGVAEAPGDLALIEREERLALEEKRRELERLLDAARRLEEEIRALESKMGR